MKGFRGFVSGLWLQWSKIWQLSLKGLMKMGFEGAVGLCAQVGWHCIASQCFCERHRVDTAGWRGEWNRGR